MDTDNLPQRCPICHRLFSLKRCFCGQRCTEPDHWLAAGLLAAGDYYLMAQLVACAAEEKGAVEPAELAVTPVKPARRAIRLRPRLSLPLWLRLPSSKLFRPGV